jgi:hypothetical protein
MKFKLAIALVVTALLLTGCAGATIGLRSSNSPSLGGGAPPPGSSYSYSSVAVQADVSPGAYFGMMFLGYVMTGIQDNYRSWSYGAPLRKPPEMAEDRAVAERDCSQPLGPLYANLRCK